MLKIDNIFKAGKYQIRMAYGHLKLAIDHANTYC